MNTDCSQCALYAELRGPRILAEIRKSADGEAEVTRRWKAFLEGYHAIHGERHADMRRLAGRYAALMAAITPPEAEVAEPGVGREVGGSDARPAPPKGRPSASRSARPSDGRTARRHWERGNRKGGQIEPLKSVEAPLPSTSTPEED